MQLVEAEEKDANAPKQPTGKTITCRLCKGGHFTSRCPYKDSLAALDNIDTTDVLDGADGPEGAEAMGALAPKGGMDTGAIPGKYVPPCALFPSCRQ